MSTTFVTTMTLGELLLEHNATIADLAAEGYEEFGPEVTDSTCVVITLSKCPEYPTTHVEHPGPGVFDLAATDVDGAVAAKVPHASDILLGLDPPNVTYLVTGNGRPLTEVAEFSAPLPCVCLTFLHLQISTSAHEYPAGLQYKFLSLDPADRQLLTTAQFGAVKIERITTLKNDGHQVRFLYPVHESDSLPVDVFGESSSDDDGSDFCFYDVYP